MKVLTAKVVDGQLDVPEGALHDGEIVTLLVQGDEEEFNLSDEQRDFLTESLEQIRRGEWVEGWQLLEQL